MLLLLGLVASGCYSPKVAIDLQDIREYQTAAEQGFPLAQYHLKRLLNGAVGTEIVTH